MSEEQTDAIVNLTQTVESQRKQIVCLTSFVGTLLGALQTKDVLHPDDLEVLFQIIGDISPTPFDRATQNILKAVHVTATEVPHLIEVDVVNPHFPHAAPLHRSR